MSRVKFTECGSYHSDNSIAIIWSVEDVHQVCDDYDIKFIDEKEGQENPLTDDEAMEVLGHVENNADCNWGVTWENIYDAIVYCHEEKIQKKESKI